MNTVKEEKCVPVRARVVTAIRPARGSVVKNKTEIMEMKRALKRITAICK